MKQKELNEHLLEIYPVWTWDDTNEFYVPVKEYNPLPEDEATLFIKASFETLKGRKLKGYLIGSDSFYAFGLFVKGKEYILNLNLPDMIKKDILNIQKDMNNESFELFPLKYESDYYFEEGTKIEGVFSIK